MKFTPKSDEELLQSLILQPGIYDFEIKGAEEKISKSGNEMIELKLNVWGHDGTSFFIIDYLMPSHPKMEWKFKSAFKACGLSKQYDAGNIEAQDFIGKHGKADIRIQKDKSGQYPDKNIVHEYIESSLPKHADTAQIVDDDLPF